MVSAEFGWSVLMAEDSYDIQLLLDDVFTECGVPSDSIIHITTQSDLMGQLQFPEKIGLIIMNQQLGISFVGTNILYDIKTDDNLKRIPVIMVTGDSIDQNKCLEIGAAAYVIKGHTGWETELKDAVRSCLT